MAHWSIPAPLDVPWVSRLRPLSSAEITVAMLEDGRIEQRIVHAALPGVTRAMCAWWMGQLDRQIDWNGQKVLAYRLWHPLDHIHFEIIRTKTGASERFHIVEAFQANPHYLADLVFQIAEQGDHGFRMELRRAGMVIASMDERWEDVPGGMRWIVTQRVGPTTRLLRPLIRFGLRRKRPMLDAWLRHNVEENGCLGEFLPQLYRQAGN